NQSYGIANIKSVHGRFMVAAFRRPDFRVDATATADPQIAGGAVHGGLSATYLFGAGVAAQPVRWTLSHQPTLSTPQAIRAAFPDDRSAFGYLAAYGPYVPPPSGQTTLDGAGRLTIDRLSERDVDAAYDYTFEGDVTSGGGQHIANRASVVVHPAPFY